MFTSRQELGRLVRAHRESKGLSQESLASACGQGVNRSIVAHLEQGLRLPKPDILTVICRKLEIPKDYWEPFTNPASIQRFEFEECLGELVGEAVGLDSLDEISRLAAEFQINSLFTKSLTNEQTFDLKNSVLIYYGITPLSREFFDKYLGPEAYGSIEEFDSAIKKYQADAIRLFSTLNEAYEVLNKSNNLELLLSPLMKNDLDIYHKRTDWDVINTIIDERLPDLGYISAARVAQESAERQTLKRFLEDLANNIRQEGPEAIDKISTKMRRRIDPLLRKFGSNIQHGLFSPLFAPDPDELGREASRLAPKTEDELTNMRQTQEVALRNFSQYLSADHMDVYVATSMRSDADFQSVNHFVKSLFDHHRIRPLKLRYFNPTQSWIDDRIAKGLVEALMLRRADITIYMAQKTDTFGKDSEASVALGQGKPVIIYVPKISISGAFDTEELFSAGRTNLIARALEDGVIERDEIDDTIDEVTLFGRIISHKLERCSDTEIAQEVSRVWADFDLYGEADRVKDDGKKAEYRKWLDRIVKHREVEIDISQQIRGDIIGILVATSINFERRAHLFREIHPLALQVILSSGVLNGILVVRSVDQCALVLSSLIRNDLDLDVCKDEFNYRLIESNTRSTLRVISRNKLLQNAFKTFYAKNTRI